MKAGTGMKNVLAGYKVSNKFQLLVRSGTAPCKFLPENTCLTSGVIHRHIRFFMTTDFFRIFIV